MIAVPLFRYYLAFVFSFSHILATPFPQYRSHPTCTTRLFSVDLPSSVLPPLQQHTLTLTIQPRIKNTIHSARIAIGRAHVEIVVPVRRMVLHFHCTCNRPIVAVVIVGPVAAVAVERRARVAAASAGLRAVVVESQGDGFRAAVGNLDVSGYSEAGGCVGCEESCEGEGGEAHCGGSRCG